MHEHPVAIGRANGKQECLLTGKERQGLPSFQFGLSNQVDTARLDVEGMNVYNDTRDVLMHQLGAPIDMHTSVQSLRSLKAEMLRIEKLCDYSFASCNCQGRKPKC